MSRLLTPLTLCGALCLALPASAQTLSVGSKKFTESVVLGEVLTGALRAEGFHVVHRPELGGTRILWGALLAGEIDAYVEYSGTLREELLTAAPGALTTAAERAPLLEPQGLVELADLGFSNTYAIGMTETRAEELGLTRLSQLADHPQLTLGVSSEFLERDDGWPLLRARYGLDALSARGLDHALAYRGLVAGSFDATDLYSTDAEIAYYGLRVLLDDRAVFPEYQALVLARSDLPERARAALSALAGSIDEGRMVQMNRAAKLDRVPAAEVASDFLSERGLADPAEGEQSSRLGLLWTTTWEHLALVLSSLLAAILVAIPLGVAAARSPRFGALVLGVVGVLQTIPSLALLVVLIPLLGIGAPPAILALFLYSLLPIVRNTHAGLVGIPRGLRESAIALGLPPRARLLLVELPLARPAILAGIKTSAVINIGTATLGALVGAGGYGQPILTGIRLDDTALILLGAVPAAVLALLAQGGLGWLERRGQLPG